MKNQEIKSNLASVIVHGSTFSTMSSIILFLNGLIKPTASRFGFEWKITDKGNSIYYAKN